MRLGVLDIGSNTVHHLIVDARTGGAPLPAHSAKHELRLAEYLDDDGGISGPGIAALHHAVTAAKEEAEAFGVDEVLAFATSALREAPNGDDVLAQLKSATGVQIQVLPGNDEARLTFLAVRRWFGWSAGRVLGLDIGGGSLEIAIGRDEEPDYATSLPFGAGRLTRDFLSADPPSGKEIKRLQRHVISGLVGVRHELGRLAAPDVVVGSSKTFRTLARATGAASSSVGPYVPRSLRRDALSDLVERLKGMSIAARTSLDGVSASRAPQLLAGALIAHTTMEQLGVTELQISPWAMREGVILRRMDLLDDPTTDLMGRQSGDWLGKDQSPASHRAKVVNVADRSIMAAGATRLNKPKLGTLR